MNRLAIAALPLSLAFAATAFAATPASTSAQWKGVSPAMVRTVANVKHKDLLEAQQMLKADGYYKGTVDGKSGPKTIAAIQMFQQKHGLKQTGWLDEPTWDNLNGRKG